MAAPKGNQYWRVGDPGRKKKITSVKDMENRINAYFDECITELETGEQFAPTVAGLAFSLNMTRETLLVYGRDDVFSDTIKEAKQIVHLALEARLYGTAVTGAIFNLKNNFGWKDQQEVVQTNLTAMESKYLKDLQGRLNVGCSENE